MKPNLVIPLASSYNQRNTLGYSAATTGFDQRKVNCFYEIAQNSISGSTTLTLSKRPGVAVNAGTFGANTQVIYLVVTPPALSSNQDPWVIVKDGNTTKASSNAATTSILVSANHSPAYVDKTIVSGTEYVVVQLHDTTNFGAAQRVYYSSAIGTWTEITNAQFTGIFHRGKAEFMDGYMFVLGSDNRIYNSDINSIANWTAGNYITRSTNQDYPLGLMRFDRQILALGESGCEVFVNAGNAAGSPLERRASHQIGLGLVTQLGDGKGHYYTTVGGRLYFLGRGAFSNFANSLIAYDGSRFEKVSTGYEDKLLAGTAAANAGAYSIGRLVVNGQEAVTIQMTAPSAATQRWLLFFPDSKSWFEWESTMFAALSNGQWFAGITSRDKVYQFNAVNNWADAGTNYQFMTQFKLPVDDGEYHSMPDLGVIGDTNSSSTVLAIAKSDDDCQTFSTLGTVDLSKVRKVIHRGGLFRDRHIRLSYTGANSVRLRKFIARVE